WHLARLLADTLDRRSARQGDVARWYRATLAAMAASRFWSFPHARTARARFPDDAGVHFFVGCLHALNAEPASQAAVAGGRADRTRLGIRSARGELGDAAAAFRRALVLEPRHAEAHLRYGRVLTLLERPREAIAELRAALPDLATTEMRY